MPNVTILRVSYSEAFENEEPFSELENRLYVHEDGRLSFYPYGDEFKSASAISACTTYDFKVIWNDCSGSSIRQLYVDNVLWLEYFPEYNFEVEASYVVFTEGLDNYAYTGPCDETLHIGEDSDGDHIWTIDSCNNPGRWTMMVFF